MSDERQLEEIQGRPLKYYAWVHFQESGAKYGNLTRSVVTFLDNEGVERYKREHDANSFGVLVALSPFEKYSRDGGIDLSTARTRLERLTTVLCEERGHSGVRPCEFCRMQAGASR